MTAARYALLTDGSTVLIRPAGPADTEAVRAMHAAMSPRSPRVVPGSIVVPGDR